MPATIKARSFPLRYRYRGGPKREHVMVAERALGKPLPKGAEVHHVDGDGANNANTNLVICQDHAYHYLLHVRTLVVRAGGDPNTQRMCGACRRPKDVSEFYLRKTDDGRQRKTLTISTCKACACARGKAYRAAKKAAA